MTRRPTTRKPARKLHGQEAEMGVKSGQSAFAAILRKADPAAFKRPSKDQGAQPPDKAP